MQEGAHIGVVRAPAGSRRTGSQLYTGHCSGSLGPLRKGQTLCGWFAWGGQCRVRPSTRTILTQPVTETKKPSPNTGAHADTVL